MRHTLSFPRHIREAVKAHVRRAVEAVSPERFQQEPAYTAALLSRLEGVAYEGTDGSVAFRTTNVNSLGPGSAERWSGADLAITADISRGDLRVTKAILAQAKLREPEDLAAAELGRLVAQIQDMKRLTRSPKVLLVRELAGRREPLMVSGRVIAEGLDARSLTLPD